jgi:hypothetical protein
LLFVAKYDVIAVLSRATRIQCKPPGETRRDFPFSTLELEIAASNESGWQEALLVMVISHQSISKSDKTLQKEWTVKGSSSSSLMSNLVIAR